MLTTSYKNCCNRTQASQTDGYNYMFRMNWLIHHQPLIQDKQQGNIVTWQHKYIRIVYCGIPHYKLLIFSPGATQPIVGVYFTALYRALASSHTRLHDHIQLRATVGRNPLNEWSVRRRDLYLTTHNTHNRQTSMRPGGIRTHDRSRRATLDLRLRLRGYWDRP